MKNITEKFVYASLEETAKKAVTRYCKIGMPMVDPNHLEIDVFQGGNFTVALLITRDGRRFVGVAKKTPTDSAKVETGVDIAIHRAVKSSIA